MGAAVVVVVVGKQSVVVVVVEVVEQVVHTVVVVVERVEQTVVVVVLVVVEAAVAERTCAIVLYTTPLEQGRHPPPQSLPLLHLPEFAPYTAASPTIVPRQPSPTVALHCTLHCMHNNYRLSKE